MTIEGLVQSKNPFSKTRLVNVPESAKLGEIVLAEIRLAADSLIRGAQPSVENRSQPLHHIRSAVGEINVVEEMKRRDAVLGGEGNGGVIVPELHYGRDALAGTAMILQHLVDTGAALSDLVAGMPRYEIVKLKTDIGDSDADAMLARLADQYRDARISLVDGVKIDLDEGWVHMRKSNTEPIIRVYAEAETRDAATSLGERFMLELTST